MQSNFNPLSKDRKSSKGQYVAESTFELLYLEIVRMVQRQYPVQVLIDSGIPPAKAKAECEYQVHTKLEEMGYQTGLRTMDNILKDQPFVTNELQLIKELLCKELWIQLFGKQMDRLQTNYVGMYVLKDDYFKPVARIPYDMEFASKSPAAQLTALTEFDALARPYVSMAMGILRGALASFGLSLSLAFRFEPPVAQPTPNPTAKTPVSNNSIQNQLKASRPTAVFTICLDKKNTEVQDF